MYKKDMYKNISGDAVWKGLILKASSQQDQIAYKTTNV